MIKKIVLTGGPCSGKSSAKEWIKEALKNTDYTVLFISETATDLITGGLTKHFCRDMVSFEVAIASIQKIREQAFCNAAKESGKDTLIICDRGILDARAYMKADDFESLMQELSASVWEEYEDYDAVFHLVTAADGALEAYTLENNKARSETPEQAIEKDTQIFDVWKYHPNFHVLDNSTDFAGKIERLISKILNLLEME